jgi:hypothetical protein
MRNAIAPAVPSPAFQPEIVPSRVEKRKDALVPFESTMPVAPAVVTEPAGTPGLVALLAEGTTTLKLMAPVVVLTT